MELIMVMLAIVGGACISIQSAVNGALGKKVGAYECAFVSFTVGAVVTGVLILFLDGQHTAGIWDVPKWKLLGACFGVPYIVVMVLATQKIGIAFASVSVVLGQCIMSMVIDNYGLFDNAIVPLTENRFIALGFLILSLYFMFQSEKKFSLPKVAVKELN